MYKPTLGILAAMGALTGCFIEEPLACTDVARSSVVLTLVDEGGEPIEGAAVAFAVDGDQVQDCDDFGDGSWVCGWEARGTLQITAEALGFAPETVDVVVDGDDCHVITEELELVLQPLNCTDDARPGFWVDVVDAQGAAITAATVQWGLADGSGQPADCEPLPLTDNQWACAEEVAGELEVSIRDAGPYVDYVATVQVEHDGCHPITETHEAVLQFLAD